MLEQEVICRMLEPLVESGIYKDESTALKDIILDYIDRRRKEYEKIIFGFSKKYKKDFEEFTKDIENSASMDEEDDWMEWKGAIEVGKSWQEAYQKLIYG